MRTATLLLIIQCGLTSIACGESLRISTYNLNWANRNGEAIVAAILEADADVVCLQESTEASETFLKNRLAEAYPHFRSAGHNGTYAAERFAVLSKRELSEVSYVPPSAGLFGFYNATIAWNDVAVQIVNVHLSPIQLQRGTGFRGVMAPISTVEEKHTAEISAIIETIDSRQPTILAGDLNSPATFSAPRQLREHGLIDGFASLHDDADRHPTWHWPGRPLPIALRIDYVFHTPHFVATEARTVRRKGSDHSLVVVELVSTTP